MPDQLTELSDEETRAAFAALHEAALHEVCAPGPGAARRALRRRRATTSSAAGLAVIVVAVGVAALTAPRGAAPPVSADQHAAAAPVRSTGDALFAVARDNLTEPMETWLQPADPGTYRFAVYCAGAGAGQVTLTAGSQTVAAPVTCADPPAPSNVELTVTTRADRLTLRVDWDPGTVLRDTAEGWAVRVVGG